MEERKNNTGLIVLITVLVILVLGMGGFIIYDKVINKTNESDIEENNSETQNTEDDLVVRKSYKVGDEVELADSSIWYVISNSEDTENFVSLLSSDNINKDYTITINNAETYLSTTYKTELVKNIKANGDEVKEVRLLTLKDISLLSGITESELQPGTSLENGITPAFLYN